MAKETNKRDFLKLIGFGSVAAVAPVAVAPSAATETKDEKRKARYQESAHVKKFYATNRY
jgi:hypothetical protein